MARLIKRSQKTGTEEDWTYITVTITKRPTPKTIKKEKPQKTPEKEQRIFLYSVFRRENKTNSWCNYGT